MTEIEYTSKLQELKNEAQKQETDLKIKYAISQRIFEIGDIIKRGDETPILIQGFATSTGWFGGLPQPVYKGVELTKGLQPKKHGDIGSIYGNENVELIRKHGDK